MSWNSTCRTKSYHLCKTYLFLIHFISVHSFCLQDRKTDYRTYSIGLRRTKFSIDFSVAFLVCFIDFHSTFLRAIAVTFAESTDRKSIPRSTVERCSKNDWIVLTFYCNSRRPKIQTKLSWPHRLLSFLLSIQHRSKLHKRINQNQRNNKSRGVLSRLNWK